MTNNVVIDSDWDESPVDMTQEANFIWAIANKLRGSYMPDKYGDVIIPMTIIRRFECALEDNKQKVVKAYEANPNLPYKKLCEISGRSFYNTSNYTLAELCNESESIAKNFKKYIDGFSPNVKDILLKLDIETHIDKMDRDGCLYAVVLAFSTYDLSIKTYDSIKMGHIFENLIGRFFQNVDAGQYYTGRDVIKLMVEILMAEGCDDIFDSGKVITVCDQACGTGGMLSTAFSYIRHFSPTADVRLFGQEFMPTSYAIGLAEILIKDQSSENFRYADTFKEDCFANAHAVYDRKSALRYAVERKGRQARAGRSRIKRICQARRRALGTRTSGRRRFAAYFYAVGYFQNGQKYRQSGYYTKRFFARIE